MAKDVLDVVTRNLTFYDQIKPKNQNEFYTVIATLNDVRTGQLIALATGTQASLTIYEDDIEDCHAESLVKRAYKRYLIDAALGISSSEISNGLRSRSKFLHNHGGQELMMFVSQFPCGLLKRYEGKEPVDARTGAVIKRKPGRGIMIDGKTVYVQRDPCLLKLKRWLSSYGLEGRSWNQTLSLRSRITHFVVGDCEPTTDMDYSKHLNDLAKELSSPAGQSIKFDTISMRRNEFVSGACKQPAPVAVVCWASGTGDLDYSVEYVVDGRRKGLTMRQRNSARDQFRLKTADYRLRSDLDKVREAFS